MSLIPEETIAQVLDRSDIVEIISAYAPLKKAGRNFKANCPFHNEKTPSFVVNPDKQIFHCFGCGVGGNVVSFIMKHERLEFPEAVRFLAQKAHIEIPVFEKKVSEGQNLKQQIFRVNEIALNYFHNNLVFEKDAQAKNAREYLKDRGIQLETAQQFKIGYAYDLWDGLIQHLRDKDISLNLMEKAGLIIARDGKDGFYDRFRHRIIFPIFDTMGHCRAFGGRALGESNAKYINSPETFVYTKGQHLFGFHLAKTHFGQEDFMVVVEGYMDCVIPFQAGVKNIIASLGTALTIDQVRLIRRYTKNIVLLFDMDPAGEAAMLRSLDLLLEEGMSVKVASLTEGDDPDSFVRKFGKEALSERFEKADSLFDYKLKALCKQHKVGTLEGKAKIADEMLQTLSKIDNAVIRSGYTRRLAQALQIMEQALDEELRKHLQKRPREAQREGEPKALNVEKQTHRKVEREILKLLLIEESFIGPTKAEIAPDDFLDSSIRQVISHLYDLFDKGQKINVSSILQHLEDDMQEMVARMVAEESLVAGDKEKMHRDYIQRIKMDRRKFHSKGLLEKIREAEENGDILKLNELKEEFNQLIKS